MDENQLKHEISAQKKAKNAIILAHNYQTGPVQDVADIVGDSLETFACRCIGRCGGHRFLRCGLHGGNVGHPVARKEGYPACRGCLLPDGGYGDCSERYGRHGNAIRMHRSSVMSIRRLQ